MSFKFPFIVPKQIEYSTSAQKMYFVFAPNFHQANEIYHK